MARIPTVDKNESLAPEHQPVYDAIVKSRGEVRGCFPALLHSPVIADHTASLGAFIRFNSQLDPKIRALAAMTTSRELNCVHEWAAGVKNAEKNGIGKKLSKRFTNANRPRDCRLTKRKLSTMCANFSAPTESRKRRFRRCAADWMSTPWSNSRRPWATAR